MAEAVLALEGVRKRYKRRGPWVLDGVNLHCESGSATAVVGGNGSGKSTLMRTATGLCDPSSGTTLRPSDVGYVPERQPARLRMTGTEYVKAMGAIRGLDPRYLRTRVGVLFDRLGLRPGPDVMFDTLSKGNRQKVLLAQALIGPASMLILDEPLSSLDRDAHGAFLELLTEAQMSGTAVLVSAHHGHAYPSSFERLRLEGGSLHAETSDRGAAVSEEVMHIILRSRDSRCDPGRIGELDGVLAINYDDDRRVLSLRVTSMRADLVLATAIASHWSVLHVEQIASSQCPDGQK